MKENKYKSTALILAALIAIGILFCILLTILRRPKSLHPAVNDTLSKWEDFTEDYEEQEIITNPESFYIESE